jgi:hypothetical protein
VFAEVREWETGRMEGEVLRLDYAFLQPRKSGGACRNFALTTSSIIMRSGRLAV